MAVGGRVARCQNTGRRRQPRSANPDCFGKPYLGEVMRPWDSVPVVARRAVVGSPLRTPTRRTFTVP